MTVEYSVQLLGIIFDILGAYYLSRGFIFKTLTDIKSETYGDPNPNSKLDLAMSGNMFVSLLVQRVEARMGFWLLLIGFILQGAGIMYPDVSLTIFLILVISASVLLSARMIRSKRVDIQRLIKIHDEETVSETADAKLNFDTIKLGIVNIRWKRTISYLLLVFLPPLLFSWPLLPDGKPFPLENFLKLSITESKNINIAELPKELPLEGISGTLGSKDFFSSIFKVETDPMPINLCFNNYNKIFEDDKEINPDSLIDAAEAGAMSFKYRRLDNNSTEEIYVKRGQINECKTLPAEGVALINGGPEVRFPLPIKIKAQVEAGGIRVGVEPRNLSIAVYQIPGYYHIQWVKYTFIKNFAQLFFAWLVILMSCKWAWDQFSSPKKSE